MPSRHPAGLRFAAAVIATTYLAPALLPGLSGLSHDVFHVVAQPSAISSGDEERVQAHPHAHVEGGPVHTHVEFVDVLLAAPLMEDALEDAHAPAPEASAPGVHLPAIVTPTLSLAARDSGPASDVARSAASLVTPPQTPPPRV
jgi:hypothetical protein